MNKITAGILALCFGVLIAAAANAQTWRQFTTADELASNRINVMLEDGRGNLWVGTDNGLSQFNRLNRLFTIHLSGMDIRALLASADGSIWAGTDYNGLWQYDGTDWHGHEEMEGKYINFLLEFSDGSIWTGTDRGLWQYDGMDWRQRNELAGREITSLVESSNGSIWAGTDNGLWQYDGMGWRILTRSDGLPDNVVTAILEDRPGSLWIGTTTGVVRYTFTYNPPLIEITKVDGATLPTRTPYLTGNPTTLIEWRASDLETETRFLTYQYKIDDDTWIGLPDLTFFFNTPSMANGEHRFSVRAIDSDFNKSEPDRLTIIVDTVQPTVVINSPVRGTIVRGKVEIKGRVEDKDLKEFWVEYAEGNDTSEVNFKEIGRSSHEVKFAQLAEWDTQSLKDMEYNIRVQATDELGHTKDDIINVTIDNTPPIAKLTEPEEGTLLGKQMQITGEVSDVHLDRYVLEFSDELDPATALWRTIFQEIDLLQAQRTEILINRTWEAPVTDQIFLRLTVIDAAGNTAEQMVGVKIPKALKAKDGGDASSSDGGAFLYIPPNSLPKDTILAINRVPEAEIQPHLNSLGVAYDFAPNDLQFNQIKPATLTIYYSGATIPPGKQVMIFKWENNAWQALGGTLNRKTETISTAVHQLGCFALMAVDAPRASNKAKIKKDSLTCQPRAFSPKGNTFNTQTTISFALDNPASVTVKVYNVAGNLVKLIAHDRLLSAGANALSWDGKDENNEIVPTGPYIITVTAGASTETKVVSVYNR